MTQPPSLAPDAGSRAGAERAFLASLAILALIGAALRAVHLEGTIGFDEAVTFRRFVQGGPAAIFALYSGYGSTNNHVLNSLAAWGSVRLFGEHVWALRLPAYLLGVAAVPLAGLVARRLTRQRAVGLATALLAAGSPILVGYSAACRGYAALLCAALASTWLLIEAVERGRVWPLPPAALALFAVGWSHMSGLVFVATCGVALGGLALAGVRRHGFGATLRGPLTRALVATLVGGIALTLWYSRGSFILQDVQHRVVHGEFLDPSLAGLKSVHASGSLMDWTEHTGKKFFGTSGSLLIVCLPITLFGLIVAWRHARYSGWVLACALLVPPLALLAGDLRPFPRYFLFVQPFVLIAVAIALVAIGRALARRSPLPSPLALALPTVGFLALVTPLLKKELSGPGTHFMGIEWDVHGAVAWVAEQLQPDDVVLSFQLAEGRDAWRERAFVPTFEFHAENRLSPVLCRPPREPSGGPRRVWYVTPNREPGPLDPLPPGLALTLAASFDGCFVHTGELQARTPHQVEPRGGPGDELRWTWNNPVGRASLAGDEWNGTVEEAVVALRVEAAGSDAEYVSPPFSVAPGRLIEVRTQVRAERGSGLRPLGRAGLHFSDGDGRPLGTVSRTALAWDRPAFPHLRATTVVPPGARSARTFVALAAGGTSGDVVRFHGIETRSE